MLHLKTLLILLSAAGLTLAAPVDDRLAPRQASRSSSASASSTRSSTSASSTSRSTNLPAPRSSSSAPRSSSSSSFSSSTTRSSSSSSAAAARIAASSSPSSVRVANPSSFSSAVFSSLSATKSSLSASSASASASGVAGTNQRVATNRNACQSTSGDAPFSLGCDQLARTVTFPDGNKRKDGGVVFLVHGTGSTADETWGQGPYRTILPNKGKGYDIAWFTSPSRSLEDAQTTAEYLAYNIPLLAKQSKTGKVFLIGHSQGNINLQWALAFYPSIRKYVSGFSSVAGDFEGTAEGPLLCVGQTLLQGGCEPSVIQQSVGSRYLAAQNARGGTALVPTTSLYTIFDDIIQPEVINPTSDLAGASVINIQNVCGPTYVVDHFTMPFAAAPFYLTLEHLTSGRPATASFLDLSKCTFLKDATVPNPFVTIPAIVRQAALDAIAVVAYVPKQTAEPLLRPYVCQTGAASTYCATA